MLNMYSWQGAGWYASEAEGGDATITAKFDTRAGRDELHQASEDARKCGCGTPRWYDTVGELREAIGR